MGHACAPAESSGSSSIIATTGLQEKPPTTPSQQCGRRFSKSNKLCRAYVLRLSRCNLASMCSAFLRRSCLRAARTLFPQPSSSFAQAVHQQDTRLRLRVDGADRSSPGSRLAKADLSSPHRYLPVWDGQGSVPGSLLLLHMELTERSRRLNRHLCSSSSRSRSPFHSLRVTLRTSFGCG